MKIRANMVNSMLQTYNKEEGDQVELSTDCRIRSMRTRTQATKHHADTVAIRLAEPSYRTRKLTNTRWLFFRL